MVLKFPKISTKVVPSKKLVSAARTIGNFVKKNQGMSTTFTDKSQQKALDHEELRT